MASVKKKQPLAVLVFIAIAMMVPACKKRPQPPPPVSNVVKVCYGDSCFTMGEFRSGICLDDNVNISKRKISPDLTAVIYRNQRIDIMSDGKDIERIKKILHQNGGDWYEDRKLTDRKCFLFEYPGDQWCLQVSVDLDNKIIGLKTMPQPTHRRNARGKIEDVKDPDPMQIEFRGHILRTPFPSIELEKILGKPDKVDKHEIHVW